MCVAGTSSLRKQLKADAVPSLFNWTSQNKYAVQRAERILRRSVHNVGSGSTSTATKAVTDDVSCGPDIATEMDVNTALDDIDITDASAEPVYEPRLLNTASQTEDEPPFNVSRFSCDDAGIHYYTGLENYDKFMYVLSTLGHSAYNLTYYSHRCDNISVPNQFFLTLIKLRLHSPHFELSRMFRISENTVANIFITWINFMAVQWRELNIFASRDLTTFFMPDDFRHKFPSTRLIIDGMECPIKKSQNPLTQQATFSSYKNRNTIKAVVGSTPGGLISYIWRSVIICSGLMFDYVMPPNMIF